METTLLAEEALSTEALGELNRRIGSVLKTHKILPYYGLQYRICEAGSSRPDPRTLRRALTELAGNRRPRHGQLSAGPLVVGAGLYANEATAAESVINHRNDLIDILTDLTSGVGSPVSTTLEAFAETSLSHARVKACDNKTRREICGTIGINVDALVIDGHNGNGVPLSVWMTHDTEWLFPDDARLWTFLEESASAGQAAIIVARKISPATFSVLKALGASGTQYYSFLSNHPQADSIGQRAKQVGWLHTVPATTILSHQVGNQLASLSSRARVPTSHTESILRKAIQMGLGGDQTATPRLVKRWAEQHDLVAPPIFWIMLDRWTQYAAYRRRTRATSSSGDPRTSDAPNADVDKHGYGRQTEVSRVPFTIR